MPAGGGFAFGPHRLEPRAKRLLRDGEPIDLSPRQFDLLHLLVSRAGEVVPKDLLIQAGWQDVAVGDSSLEKQIFHLRERLDVSDSHRYIETVPRHGYRFTGAVEPVDAAADIDL